MWIITDWFANFLDHSSNTFLEPRIQPLHDGLSIVEKVLGVRVQHMLEMSRFLYTCGIFKQSIAKKRIENG